MKRILAIAVLFASAASQAGEWGLQVHGQSHHFQKRNYFEWNEFNPGLALRYSFDADVSVQAGRYLNSYSLPGYEAYTNYVSADYTPWHYKMLSAGLYAGAGTGYDEPMFYIVDGQPKVVRVEKRPVVFSGGIALRLDHGRFNLTGRINPGMVTLEYGIKF